MVEFWDAGVTDTGREEEAAGDIQDTFHKRYARQTLELDSGGRVKAVRLYLYIVRSYTVHKCTCQVLSGLVYSNKPPPHCQAVRLILVTIFRSITTIK